MGEFKIMLMLKYQFRQGMQLTIIFHIIFSIILLTVLSKKSKKTLKNAFGNHDFLKPKVHTFKRNKCNTVVYFNLGSFPAEGGALQ